ncbi:putative endo-1,4-beta-xylanase, partial [Operophtera brumata]
MFLLVCSVWADHVSGRADCCDEVVGHESYNTGISRSETCCRTGGRGSRPERWVPCPAGGASVLEGGDSGATAPEPTAELGGGALGQR